MGIQRIEESEMKQFNIVENLQSEPIFDESEVVFLGNATDLTMGSSGEQRERGSHRPPLNDD